MRSRRKSEVQTQLGEKTSHLAKLTREQSRITNHEIVNIRHENHSTRDLTISSNKQRASRESRVEEKRQSRESPVTSWLTRYYIICSPPLCKLLELNVT